MSRFSPMPAPPYYAVIFTNQASGAQDGYTEMADKMVALAEQQDGFIGVESTRDVSGLGITVSYWDSEAALLGWKAVASHMLAQKLGKDRWYQHYALRVAKVERQYEGPEGR